MSDDIKTIVPSYKELVEQTYEIDEFLKHLEKPADVLEGYKMLKRMLKQISIIIRSEAFIELSNAFIRIDKKYNENYQYIMLRRLIEDGTISPLEKILKYLDIKRKTFDEDMKIDPNQFRIYYRQKVESRVSNYYDMLQNLEAQNRIGKFGQRIPDMFDAVSSSFAEESLPKKIRDLLAIKNDLTDLVFATTEIFMIYQSAMDLSFQIDVMKFDERNRLYDEVKKLAESKEKIAKEVADLKLEKIEIENQIRRTNIPVVAQANNQTTLEDDEDDESDDEDDDEDDKVEGEEGDGGKEGDKDGDEEDDDDDYEPKAVIRDI